MPRPITHGPTSYRAYANFRKRFRHTHIYRSIIIDVHVYDSVRDT